MTTIAILLPDLRGGGAERVAVNLANAFVERGLAVDLVLMSAVGELLPALRPEINVVALNVTRMRGLLMPLLRYLRNRKPGVLLACMWPLTVTAIVAGLLARAGTRVVVAEHTTWSAAEIQRSAFQRLFLKISMRLLFPKAGGVITVSRGAAGDLAQLAALPASVIRTIYNPIAVARSMAPELPRTPAAWCANGHKRLLAVGTLKAIKDYPVMLRAFARLRSRVNARLLILGEGAERGALEQLARELGIDAFIDLPGFVADPTPYFAHADLHILSSRGEGFGNVIVEALEQGVPVVSTDCPSGPREILGDGVYGRLVPVGDDEALANAIEASLGEISDRKALQARAQDFSVEKSVDQYLDVLVPARRKEVAP